MDFTGERFLPAVKGIVELEHLHRYFLAANFVKNLEVLDVACGEGYGCDILSNSAKHVYGVDMSEESIRHASDRYRAGNVEFRCGDCCEIPLADSSVDVVTSFETIEHHMYHDEMLDEILRVLRPNGLLIMSTPDKDTFIKLGAEPNPFHVKELRVGEFKDFLKTRFSEVELLFQKVMYGSFIFGDSASGMLHYKSLEGGLLAEGDISAPYVFAFATNQKMPVLNASVYEVDFCENEIVRALQRDKAKLKRKLKRRLFSRLIKSLKKRF